MIELNKILQGDALEQLRLLPDGCIDCCVTSPPYWGLRDYGTAVWIGGDENCSHKRDTKNNIPDWLIQSRGKVDNGVGDEIFKDKCAKCGAIRIDSQLGLEKTPYEYIQNVVLVFREVKRVLKKNGTLWLNIGDSYAGSWGNMGHSKETKRFNNYDVIGSDKAPVTANCKTYGLKPKDLVGIPWMLAFALRADGWWLRQDIIWAKPNPMPESVTDRCTKSHEYIFLLGKSNKYYYDAFSIATQYKDKTLTTFGCEVKGNGDGSGLVQSENWANTLTVRKPKEWKTPDGWDTGKGPHGTIHIEGREKGKKGYEHRGPGDKKLTGHSGNHDSSGNLIGTGKANKRSVWTIATVPYKEAHFATFPQDLIIDCIKAGCPEGGIVLDPFLGAGTTALVARKLNRNYVGIELNPEYIKIANKRLKKELGMFI